MDRVCHFEIPFSEKERAEKFYQDVFSWQIMPAPGDMPYSFALTTPVNEEFKPKDPGGINGGMYPRDDRAPTSRSPVVVIEVDSCEQRLADVIAAGGAKVTDPIEIPMMGIYAQVKDTEDNIIGLWQAL